MALLARLGAFRENDGSCEIVDWRSRKRRSRSFLDWAESPYFRFVREACGFVLPGGAKSGQKGQKRSKRGPPRRFFHCLLKTSAFPVLPFPFLLFFLLQYTTSLLFFPVFFFSLLHNFFLLCHGDWSHGNRITSRKLNRFGISTGEAPR